MSPEDKAKAVEALQSVISLLDKEGVAEAAPAEKVAEVTAEAASDPQPEAGAEQAAVPVAAVAPASKPRRTVGLVKKRK